MPRASRTLSAALLGLLALALPAGGRDDAPKPPARVLLIRHAEKPPPSEGSVHINAAGKERAAALVRLFEASKKRPEPFPKPDFLFAAKDSSNSHRSTETLAPLGKALGLKVNAEYKAEDFAGLARAIRTDPKYAGKTVLVCWRHSLLPDLARKLGTGPQRWKDETFDRVWEVTYDERGKATLRDLPQRLMPGDAKK